MSRAELARLANLGEAHIYLIETGQRKRIEAETIIALAGVLG